MPVSLLGRIYRYQGVNADIKPTDGVLLGSQFYERDTTNTYVFNGATWDAAPAFNGLFMPTADEKDAMDGAASPAAGNVFATVDDTASALAAALANLLSALPAADPTTVGALWNNGGVLTVSAG